LNSAFRNPHSAFPLGISLIEVLISMFVLLFGLMGVAALFPVGNFYAQKGEKYDLGGALGQTAMEALKTRGLLRPEKWLYASNPPGQKGGITPAPVMLPNTGRFNVPLRFGASGSKKEHPGHAFVIDPLGMAAGASVSKGTPWLESFPLWNKQQSGTNNKVPVMIRAWRDAMTAAGVVSGTDWPVRRLTLDVNPNPNTPFSMTGPVADILFRLRDDLVVEQPKQDDHPAIQRWEVADPNNTPNDPTDDSLLARQFQGNYSWLATIVPTSTAALAGLQPADSGYGQYDYEVSVVVFRKRDITPSAESERLVDARLLVGGEIEMFIQGNNSPANLDPAFQDIRSGDWIAVMGVHPTTGVFLLKWYRMLALDRETSVNPNNTNEYLRRAMLAGPDWPFGGSTNTVAANLKVALLPGAIGVVTKPMKMETDSLWRIE